jgi:hypothetical protein
MHGIKCTAFGKFVDLGGGLSQRKNNLQLNKIK